MAWDANLVISDKTDVTADAQTTALDLDSKGYPGGIVQFRMWVEGAISGTSPKLLTYIEQSSDNSNWEKIAVFPELGTANHPNATYASNGGHVDAYGQVTKRYVRANFDISGTSPVYNDVTIRMRGIDAVGPR